MIKILTGYSNLGGSTIAHIALCNAFNKRGMECMLYGPHSWHLNKCKSDYLKNLTFTDKDDLIFHYLPVTARFNVRNQILSCHETDVFPIKQHSVVYDKVHFVSEAQKQWQGIDGVVIPNIVERVNYSNPNNKVAGIIGSIHPHKQTHVSIKRALDSGYKVMLAGEISDPNYFMQLVYPLISLNVKYVGILENKEQMYNEVEAVFHSSQRETFNLVRQECKLAGIPYFGMESCDTEVEILTEQEIIEKWKNLLYE